MCGGKKESAEVGSAPGAREAGARVVAAQVVAVVPEDDREITDQFRRLYGTVHTWSSHFLAPPPAIPRLTEAEDQLVRAVVLLNSLDPILESNPLRRSVMEGLVGHQISVMLDIKSMSPVHLEIAPVHS